MDSNSEECSTNPSGAGAFLDLMCSFGSVNWKYTQELREKPHVCAQV